VILILNGPKKKGKFYDELKRYLTKDFPIPSQAILTSTIQNRNNLRVVCNKMLVQIVAKTGGVPWTVSQIPFSDSPTMLFGIDVYHAGGKKSILAVTATLDNTFGMYSACCSVHDEGQELGIYLQQAIKRYLIE
jgi:aubergine-like protein